MTKKRRKVVAKKEERNSELPFFALNYIIVVFAVAVIIK